MRKSRKLNYVGDRVRVEKLSKSPVKIIKPKESKPEDAELCTIAVILLRKNKDLFRKDDEKTPEVRYLYAMWLQSSERRLTESEAKKTVAIIAALKG